MSEPIPSDFHFHLEYDHALPVPQGTTSARTLVAAWTVFCSRPVSARWSLALAWSSTSCTTGRRFRWMMNSSLFPSWMDLAHPAHLLLGLPFSVTLMFILFAHEMGHYLFCRHYGVHATPPFFIPSPSLIGTLGAFIRIKAPIRSRAALFDIGIAGPIAGFVLRSRRLVLALSFRIRLRRGSDHRNSTGISARSSLSRTTCCATDRSRHALRAASEPLSASDCGRGMGRNVRHRAQPVASGQLDGGHIVFCRRRRERIAGSHWSRWPCSFICR